MKIKQSLVGVGLGLALLLAACGGTNNPLGEASPPHRRSLPRPAPRLLSARLTSPSPRSSPRSTHKH